MTAASALGICRRFVAAPSWADLKPSEFSVAAVTGGLTNKLFKATNKRPGADPHHVLLRIYCGMSLTLPYSPDAPFWMSLLSPRLAVLAFGGLVCHPMCGFIAHGGLSHSA